MVHAVLPKRVFVVLGQRKCSASGRGKQAVDRIVQLDKKQDFFSCEGNLADAVYSLRKEAWIFGIGCVFLVWRGRHEALLHPTLRLRDPLSQTNWKVFGFADVVFDS